MFFLPTAMTGEQPEWVLAHECRQGSLAVGCIPLWPGGGGARLAILRTAEGRTTRFRDWRNPFSVCV